MNRFWHDLNTVVIPLFGITMFLMFMAAWFTHIYRCFTEGEWGFLIAGAIMFPIAWFHGVGIWLGVW